MREENIIVVDRTKDGKLAKKVLEALRVLPDGFLPEFAFQFYSADYLPKLNTVRIACEKRFDVELPKGAKWKREKLNYFSYKGFNYRLLFWD